MLYFNENDLRYMDAHLLIMHAVYVAEYRTAVERFNHLGYNGEVEAADLYPLAQEWEDGIEHYLAHFPEQRGRLMTAVRAVRRCGDFYDYVYGRLAFYVHVGA